MYQTLILLLALCASVSSNKTVSLNNHLTLDKLLRLGYKNDTIRIYEYFEDSDRDSQFRTIESTAFSIFKSLESLYIRNTKLSTISSGDFKGLTKLRVLDLAENYIASISKNAFRDLTSLEV